MKKVRVGAGSSGWPDFKDGALDVARNGDIDYMSFDHLAELTMAILQSQRAKDPNRGYIPEVLPLMRDLLPIWKEKDKHFRMANNGGGANPGKCADEVLKISQELNLGGIKIGVVTGDDIPLSKVDELRAQGLKFKNLDTGEEDIGRVRDRLLGAYAYTGADKIIEAYEQGANLVLTGRASDNSLYCGNFMHPLGWKFEDEYVDRIGMAVIVGHLLECSSWSAGTCSNLWEELEYPKGNPGFPIAEMDEDGGCIITKTPNSGGGIRVLTLKEHLVYEVHDPHNYLMPDGIADITTIKLEQIDKDVVRVSKLGDASRGKKRPDTLKFCLAYNDGYISEETTVISGPKVFKMAEKMEDFIYKRLDYLNLHPKEVLISLVGYNSLQGPTVPPPDPDHEPNELGFRAAFKCDTREEARACRTECGHLAWGCCGPGIGFTQPPAIRPVFALWPTLIPREAVVEQLEIKEG